MLKKIIESKIEEIKKLKLISIKREKPVLNVVESLKKKPIIAEIKKASPSKGVINDKIDIVKQAKKYQEYGAGAISVLTDKNFFKGSFEDLCKISKSVNIPVLCKDFILDEIQIENAYNCGADFILIIVYILDDFKLKALVDYAKKLNLNILFEVHSLDDFSRIKKFNPEIVGVNSRNFHSLKIEKDRAINVIKNLKGDFLKVAESGISTKKDIEIFKNAGADAFLIGTAFMEASDVKRKFEEFYSIIKR